MILLKKIIISLFIFLCSFSAIAQTITSREIVNYEAANWKLWMLDSSQQIMVNTPPNAAQSKTELQLLQSQINKLNDSKLTAIRYWNAGAPAYRWNEIAPKLVEQQPQSLLRMPAAWMNIAIYDATILAWKEKIKYKRQRPAISNAVVKAPLTYSYPCEHTVTAAAAATVLAYFFPEKADSILQMAHTAAQSRNDAGVQFPSDVDAGWKLGEQVAKQIFEKAKNDGSSKTWDGNMNKDITKWTGNYPFGITASTFSPIALKTPNQFRPIPPPNFENDMKELKDFKQTFQSNSNAYYWANFGGPDYWSGIAAQKMFEYRMSDDAPAVARIYTTLYIAYHDAVISIFDAKYAYWGIRPFQYDTTYKPLISTPPFPGYPSGHAIGASTSSTVLGYFFPADAKQFQQLAKDCAQSRFDAGIHFRTDNEVGLQMGKEIGKFVVETLMKK
jgi:membrane-associated phospholipid phosphatase